MENIEILKQELLSQKEAIEEKGGSVSVSNLNPSPSEITSGIKSISVPNLSNATAIAEDVAFGKTFYAGDNTLKTGTQEVADLTIATALPEDVSEGKTFYAGDKTLKTGTQTITDFSLADATEENVENGKKFYAGTKELKTGSLIVPDMSLATATEEDVSFGKTFYAGSKELKTGTKENSSGESSNEETLLKLFVNAAGWEDETVYFTVPEGVKKLQSYMLYDAGNKKIEITFNSDLEEISSYDFYKCVNTSFPNFSSLTKLHTVGTYSFGLLTQHPIDFENLPESITNLGLRCFNQTVPANSTIKIPRAVNTAGNYIFASAEKQEMRNLIMPDDIALTTLPGYMFENMIFDCDFRIPATVTSLAAGFCYGCSFNNITIPATCTNFGNAAFFCLKNEAASYRNLKTVTFESETPPTMGANPFAEQDKTNGFKIYVPDNAVDEYKAYIRLSNFVDYIYPVSQKE